MAHQIDTEFKGTIGNLIFYERYGKFLIRTVQVQAEGSQKSAQNFGAAASRAKLIRSLLAPVIANSKDKEMQNRLTVATRKFLASSDNPENFTPNENALAGFRFVPTSELKNCLRFPFSLTALSDGTIRFEIPGINPRASVSAPSGTSHAELKVMAVSFNPESNDSFAGNPEVLSILYTNSLQPASQILLQTGRQETSVTLVAAALTYWNNTKQINKTGFMPVEIVAAFK